MSLQTNKQDHDELRRMMDEFVLLMPGGPQEDAGRMAQLRIRFSALFRDHLRDEHITIKALRSDTPGCPFDAAAREHCTRTQALFLDYSAHINRWTPQKIRSDPTGYRQSVLALQHSLRAMMDWEERTLYELLAKN